MRRGVIVWFGLLALSGCDGWAPEAAGGVEAEDDVVQAAAPAPAPAGYAVGADPDVCDNQCGPVNIDPMRSLVVTDPVILANFDLVRVLDQLLALSGSSISPQDLWRQWWASQRMRAPGDPAHWPFCDDPGPLPGQAIPFGFECPRNESLLEGEPLDSHIPIALFNRFDLAAMDGSHCGEYRIVYAADPAFGLPGENLIIFEGLLPNPNPGCGLAACTAVAEFWAALSTEPNAAVRGAHLEDFYFNGICNYPAVVRPEHYGWKCQAGGGYGSGCGQIRTNQFLQPPWTLRQFKLDEGCDAAGNCELMVRQTAVSQNPHPDLWDSTNPNHMAFNPSLIGQLAANLPIPDSVNLISAATDPRLNASESVEQPAPGFNLYDADPPFEFTIDTNLGPWPSITHLEVENRVTAQSCAGCHEIANGMPLGHSTGGTPLNWPNSLGFKHVDIGGVLSPALTNHFLPWREQVLNAFLASTCGQACLSPADNAMLVKQLKQIVADGDEPHVGIDFKVVTYDEWLEQVGEDAPYDTLSGSKTH